MLKNYLKIAWRTLFKNRYFALINIGGLGIGIAACLFIVQYVFFESNFDAFHEDAASIYRVKHSRYENNVLVEESAITFSAVSKTIKQEFPEIKTATGIAKQDCIISVETNNNDVVSYKENDVLFVDESFFEVFSFPLLRGSKEVLKEANAVILTQHLAHKLFGNQDPIGKTVRAVNFNQGTNLELAVKGIIEDVPANSHLKFSCLITAPKTQGSWKFIDDYTYVKFNQDIDVVNLNSRLSGYINKYVGYQTDGVTHFELSFQPLTSIHLYSDLTKEAAVNGNGKLVWFMVLIAALILIIAYVNYINLSTIKSMDRAREVGLRRTFGSQKGALIAQFFFESLILSFIGIILAVILVLIFKGGFAQLTGIEITAQFWMNYKVWIGLVVLLFLGSFLSSLYPAYLLSSYNPVQILKGKLPIGGSGTLVRKGLVVFQFIISISLIIGTFTIYKQLQFMRTKDLGINMERNIIVVAPSNSFESQMGGRNFYQKMDAFRTKLKEYPEIKSVTSSSSIPGLDLNWSRPYKRKNAVNKNNLYATFSIGPEFIKQFEIESVAGKVFNENMISINQMPTGNTPILLNEAAIAAFGFESPESAIGEFLTDVNGAGMEFEYEIIGVIKNFHQKSLKEALTPIVFRLEDGSSIEYYAIKTDGQNLSKTITAIEGAFKENFPVSPYDFFFLDEFFNEQYKVDQQFGKIFTLFASLAIFITCLGLFGLSLFTSFQKAKEIAIRKVLGASVVSLLVLLIKDFIKLIILASTIAWVVSWWGLEQWLQSYPSRIGIDYLFFVYATFIVLLIAFVIIGAQSWKVDKNDPLIAIKQE